MVLGYPKGWGHGIPVYDDGCHLRKFATNPVRSELTTTAQRIAKTRIVVDKMHFKGHIDPWCKSHCNPYDFEELKMVVLNACYSIKGIYIINTQGWYRNMRADFFLAIQICSHYEAYEQEHFMFYIMYIYDIHNRKKEKKRIKSD